jgi:hypothetical protein
MRKCIRDYNRLICYIHLVCCLLLFVLSSCGSDKNIKIGQENALWSESVYLRGHRPSNLKKLTEIDILKYAEILKNNNIKYAYLFAGPFNKDGSLPDYSFSNIAINSVALLKEICPDIVILPWVGGIQNKTVFLDDSIWVKNALNSSKKLVQTLSVHGLHLDFEFILEGNPYLDRTEVEGGSGDIESYGNNVIEFHRKLRLLMPEAFISSVVPSTSPGTRPWKKKPKLDELKVLIQYIDQLSFLYFDTHINNRQDFEENCLFLIKDIQQLRNSDNTHSVQFLVGIGTFINTPELQKYRNMQLENIPNTLKTIKNSILEVSPNKQIVDGISIFCDWETSETEWDQIYDNWTNQNH